MSILPLVTTILFILATGIFLFMAEFLGTMLSFLFMLGQLFLVLASILFLLSHSFPSLLLIPIHILLRSLSAIAPRHVILIALIVVLRVDGASMLGLARSWIVIICIRSSIESSVIPAGLVSAVAIVLLFFFGWLSSLKRRLGTRSWSVCRSRLFARAGNWEVSHGGIAQELSYGNVIIELVVKELCNTDIVLLEEVGD